MNKLKREQQVREEGNSHLTQAAVLRNSKKWGAEGKAACGFGI